ncbi:MAG: hypothetical protein WBG54_14340 [Acidobacteriaceae bacterium]
MRAVGEALELAETTGDVPVAPEEYARLLGYPRGYVLEGRARELADWARGWYAQHGRPWLYARQAESFSQEGDAICIDGAAFTSPRLQQTLNEAGAHSMILAAAGAGREAEDEAQRRWAEEKPDEYFFLEIYGSAVVEHQMTALGARLCDWAEQQGMAVLPHASPGYPEWDVAEQPRLLDLMRRTRGQGLPAEIEALDSGMLRPRKSQLAVFGLTRHTERLQRLTSLVPCESCSFGPCQYRRAPYRRAPRSTREPLPTQAALDADARYSTSRKALERWAAERLLMNAHADGSIDVLFRYDGTTCTNMGRALAFDYHVTLGPRAEGYPIREQRCVPAARDTGHRFMCQFLADAEGLMGSIGREKPLNGEPLNAVLQWRTEPCAAGCFCDAAARNRKWALVLETIHYALAQKERNEELR